MKERKKPKFIKVNIGRLLRHEDLVDLSYEENPSGKLLKDSKAMSKLYGLVFDSEVDYKYDNGLFYPTIHMSGTEDDLKEVADHFDLEYNEMLELATV